MNILDSRRLTGAGLLLDGPGAVVDVELGPAELASAVDAWRRAARRALDAVGWGHEVLAIRIFEGGASLALSAPPDALYAATELNEWAWRVARAAVLGEPAPDSASGLERVRGLIAEERDPKLLALHAAAGARGVTFLSGEEQVSVGSGTGVRSWPAGALPGPAEVDWDRVHDVPVVLVTGSNGKTTVVRLLAALLAESGRVAGTTSTDGVTVGGMLVAEGDFSGPSGARMLLRLPEVEVAVLETARGGLLRRGLPVGRAAAAVVTNVADDHLGEFGVQDLGQLADVKLLVARAVGADGTVVLNADDRLLRERAGAVAAPIHWFTMTPGRDGLVGRHLAGGGRAAVYERDTLVLAHGAEREGVAPAAELPIAFAGAARHNVANALAAIAAASALGFGHAELGHVLRRFGRADGDNLGRANLVSVGGVGVLVDFAHNPHGMAALVELASAVESRRRLVLLGQAGDRTDQAIRDLARAALGLRPDRIVLKDMEIYLRGRRPGEVPALMADELRRLGVPEGAVSLAGDELAGVREALAWAAPGDLLVLTVHDSRPAVLELLERLRTSGWTAGEAVPA